MNEEQILRILQALQRLGVPVSQLSGGPQQYQQSFSPTDPALGLLTAIQRGNTSPPPALLDALNASAPPPPGASGDDAGDPTGLGAAAAAESGDLSGFSGPTLGSIALGGARQGLTGQLFGQLADTIGVPQGFAKAADIALKFGFGLAPAPLNTINKIAGALKAIDNAARQGKARNAIQNPNMPRADTLPDNPGSNPPGGGPSGTPGTAGVPGTPTTSLSMGPTPTQPAFPDPPTLPSLGLPSPPEGVGLAPPGIAAGHVDPTFAATMPTYADIFGDLSNTSPVADALADAVSAAIAEAGDSGAGPSGDTSDGSGVGAYFHGGSVQGPQGRDQVPARLTQGEFVMNANAAQQFRSLLEYLNSMTPPNRT